MADNPFDQFDNDDGKEENPFDQFEEGKAMTVARIAGRGVPILGQFISETPETRQFEKDNPFLSGAIGLGAGTLATLPLAGPLAAGGAAVKGLGLIPSLFRSGSALAKTAGMGAGVGGLDEYARQLAQGEDMNFGKIASSGAVSGALGAGAPLAGKLLSPGLRTPTVDRMGRAALLSGLAGFGAGFNPFLAALLGGGARAYGSNRTLNRPATQAVLSALGTSGGAKIDDAVTTP